DPDPISLIAADINGDKRPDLISVSYDYSTLTVLTNNGHGMFGSNAVYKIDPNEYSGLYSVAAADVNGDGSTDLLVAMYGNVFSVQVLTNNGSGVFRVSATYGDDEGIECVIAADVNGDKRPDLIYANSWSNSVTVMTNDGTGAFVLSGTYSVGDWPISIAAVD